MVDRICSRPQVWLIRGLREREGAAVAATSPLQMRPFPEIGAADFSLSHSSRHWASYKPAGLLALGVLWLFGAV
jgi:hypothetical protein